VSLDVIVLAAGQGKRMRSALPKVLQPLAGKPLLEHVLETASALAPRQIHVVFGHGGDAVKAHFAKWDLNWCHQAQQLGTGHAVLQAMPDVPTSGRVLVLCGDVPLARVETLQSLLNNGDAPVAVLTAELDDPTGYGRIMRDANANVTGIVEEKDATPGQRDVNEINTGIMVMDVAPLRTWLGKLKNDNAQGEYYLTDVIALAAAEGCKVAGVLAPQAAELLGINDKAQLAATERAYQRRVAARLMAEGATLTDPDRIDVRGKLAIGRDVCIDVGAVFIGNVTLGDSVRIGPNCVIANSELGADTELTAFCHLDGVQTGESCVIGPFARLRPGTVLADKVKIGNFVEIKKSDIAEGSKVNHLTYIGDSVLGPGVNVGAGTITCNYDGANKHQTVIGANAFIGSGVMLVAPVEVGAGATIGAGSTINKDAPENSLTLARARQITIEGWNRPVKKSK
jgi:bifunctional UDP-N-acetylglucosamine pyrophosphorylase/glucosamine-1-phosphate N-acetyltransferase